MDGIGLSPYRHWLYHHEWRGSDDPIVFNPDIFNFQRISLAPALVLLGFAVEVWAILYTDKKEKES